MADPQDESTVRILARIYLWLNENGSQLDEESCRALYPNLWDLYDCGPPQGGDSPDKLP